MNDKALLGSKGGDSEQSSRCKQKSLLQDGWQQDFAFYSCWRLLGKT
jgi:hypothetical protein